MRYMGFWERPVTDTQQPQKTPLNGGASKQFSPLAWANSHKYVNDRVKICYASLKGIPMHYPEDTEPKEHTDTTEDQHLVLDGTVNLDYSDDDVPHIKGLIELLKEYFGAKNIWVSDQVEAASR